mgnify:CR=1 FL=1
MAEFVAKLGLDSTAFISGMENAAKSTGQVNVEIKKVEEESKKIGGGFQGANAAIDGLKGKLTGLGSTFADVGKNAIGVLGGGLLLGGIQGLVGGFDSLISKGLEIKKTQNELKAAFAGAGVASKDLDATVKANAKNVERLSYEYAVSKSVVNDATKAFINFGGKSTDLGKTQEQLIVLQQRYGLSAEAAGKLLGKATDPENEASLKRLGIVFDKNATEAERQAKIQSKLAESMTILKEQANGPVGSIERFKNSLAGFKGAIAASLIESLAPIMEQMSVAAKFVIDNVLPELKKGIAAIKDVLSPVADAIKEGFGDTLKTAFDGLKLAFNGISNLFKNLSGDAQDSKSTLDQIKGVFQFLSPAISAVTAALTAYYGAMLISTAYTKAAEVATKGIQAVKAAYAFITGTATVATEGETAAQWSLNAAFAANPIGLTIAAIAGLAAGIYYAYQKSETFRNIIQSLWEWVKKAVGIFIELQMKFNPIIALFKLAYDNITPFRQAVDYVIGLVMKAWDAVKGFASAIGDLFGSAGNAQDKTKEKKPDDTLVQVNTDATKAVNATADAEKKADEASKKRLDTAKDLLTTKVKELEIEAQRAKANIEQKAIDEKRQLTEAERIKLLQIDQQLNKDKLASIREIFKVTGEGANIKIGLRLNKEQMNDARNGVLDEIKKLSEENVKIGFEFVKISDEAKKIAAANLKADITDAMKSAKDQITVDALLRFKTDGESAGRVAGVLQSIQQKIDDAQAAGFTELASSLTDDYQKLEDDLSDILKKSSVQRGQIEIEKQREAETKRRDIVKAFTDAVDEVRKKSAEKAMEAAKNTAALDAEEAALLRSLKNREISYEEYSNKIAELDKKRLENQDDAQKSASSVLKTEFSAVVKGLNASLTETFGQLRKTADEDFKKTAESGELNYQALATSAATLFGTLVVNGANAAESARQVLKQTAAQVLDTLVAPIIGSYLSFLGPFALPVALAAVGSLKALLNSAISGFREGGFTGTGSERDIAGVVHGQEFVHTASVTRRNRPLFEYLHKGGDLSSWVVSQAGSLQTPASQVPVVSTYGIESRLDRLETAIVKSSKRFDSMRAVKMTVEHDPTLTIKAHKRDMEVRSARV